MESYSSSSSASSTTTYLSQTMQPTKQQPLPYHHSSLHSVRRSTGKPWRKPSVAPLPPTPPRVYKVDPINFRDLVQSLTSAPEFLETRTLQSVAPPPIDIHVSSVPNHGPSSSPASKISSPFSVMYKDLSETLGLNSPAAAANHPKVHDNMVDSSYLRLNLQSPSSQHWFSFPLLSPGTLSSLEQSTVL